MPKQFSIIAGTLWGNRGAEAMLVTTIGTLREKHPDAIFNIFSYYPKEDADLCIDPSIHIYDARPLSLVLKLIPLCILGRLFGESFSRLFKSVHALKQSDTFFDVGGITFNDGRLVFLLYNIASLLPAFILQVPVVKLSQALGPFEKPVNKTLGKFVLSKCKKIFARGKQSCTHLESLKLENFSLAADIAFSYQDSFSLTKENLNLVKQIENKLSTKEKIICCMPSAVLAVKDPHYVSMMSLVLNKLIEEKYHILLLPQASRASSNKYRNNDIKVIKEILEGIESKAITVVDFDLATAEIRSLLKCSKACITSRFHGMIASLSLGITPIVFGWSHKYEEVLDMFGLSELAIPINSESPREVLKLIHQSSNYGDQIKKHLAEVKKMSLEQFNLE